MAGRDIAVKRLLGQFVHAAKKEIEILIKSDEHPNIVRCFAMEEDSDFVYIALERCDQSLYDYVEHSKVVSPVRPLEHNVEKLILEDICQGLSHLHNLGRTFLIKKEEPSSCRRAFGFFFTLFGIFRRHCLVQELYIEI